MMNKELDELAVARILDGGVVALSADPGNVLRVRLVNGMMVIDKLPEAVYTERHGQGGVGGSVISTLDNP